MRNKKQHWVPAWFLARFSETPGRGRKAKLWVSDGRRTFPTTVDALAVQRDFYSAGVPSPDLQGKRDEEQIVHGELELGLNRAIQRFEKGDRQEIHLLDFFLLCAHLSMRTPRFECEGQRLDALNSTTVPYFARYFLGTEAPIQGEEGIRLCLEELRNSWQFELVGSGSETDDAMICSDNPVVLLGSPEGVQLLFLPISSTSTIVAAKRAQFRITSLACNSWDIGLLNTLQAIFAVRHVFSGKPFSQSGQLAAASLATKRPVPDSSLAFDMFETKSYSAPEHLPSFLSATTRKC